MRREIQGLRAVAVTLVVLFHLWPNRLAGGYVGVDVFFVVSGFLITSHLLREVDRTGSVRLADFWARRARRLLPAAYLVLLVSAAGAALWVPTMHWQQFFKEIGAAAVYVENWTLAADSVDYLAADNAPSPAQHYWTLSAEEQFYLVWPLLVVAATWWATRRARHSVLHGRSGRRADTAGAVRRSVAVTLGAVTAGSLAYSLYLTATNPAAAYFVTPTRAWEFGAGALLAFVPVAVGRHGLRAVLSGASLATIAVCAVVLTADTPMPGTAAIVVVAASALFLWSGDPEHRLSPVRLLRPRPVQYLGDISYSVYLWHWPLIVLLPYATGEALTTLQKLGIGLGTLALAAATKRWVEDPVRRTQRLGLGRAPRALALTAVGALVLVGVCGAGWRVAGDRTQAEADRTAALLGDAPACFGAGSRDPQRSDCPDPALDGTLVPAPSAIKDDYPKYDRCVTMMEQSPLRGCAFGTPRRGVSHVALIGDSHAKVLMAGLEPLVDEGRLSVDLFQVGGCTWATGKPFIGDGTLKQTCATYKARLQPLLARTAKDYDAVLTTSWASNMRGSDEERVRSIVDAWKPVVDAGVPIVAFRDNPQGGRSAEQDPNACLVEVEVAQANARCGLSRARSLDRVFDPYRPAVERTPGARYVDLSSFFCDQRSCPVVIGGVNVYRDNSHVSVTYMRTMAPYLERALVDADVLRAD